MDGSCSSGNDRDCRWNGTKYSHIIWCGEDQPLALDFASYCYWKTGDFTELVQCSSNELAMGLCSSSSRNSCSNQAMAVKCCSLKTYQVFESSCNWLLPQSYGAESHCPSGKYASGFLSSTSSSLYIFYCRNLRRGSLEFGLLWKLRKIRT